MFCPACISAASAIIAGSISSGGFGAFFWRLIHRKNAAPRRPSFRFLLSSR